MIEDYLPDERLDIYFKVVEENRRIIKIIPHGKQYEDLCEDAL